MSDTTENHDHYDFMAQASRQSENTQIIMHRRLLPTIARSEHRLD